MASQLDDRREAGWQPHFAPENRWAGGGVQLGAAVRG